LRNANLKQDRVNLLTQLGQQVAPVLPLFNPQSTIRNPQSRVPRAFSIIELLIVITLLGIAFGLAIPTMGDSKELKLQEAAKMLAADFEFAQNDSISHASDPRLVKFNTTTHQYWIAAVSAPDTPITDPVTNSPYLLAFGTGRGAGTSGVTIQSISVGGDTELRYDAYGTPDQSTNATVTLACGPATMTVQVAAGSGEVTIY